MKRSASITLTIGLTLALVAATAISDRPVMFGDPLPGLTPAQLDAFNSGKAGFAEVETVADGLGPVFNGRSCAECHSAPIVGGGSERVVTRFGTMTNGVFNALSELGGSLMQDHAITSADGSPHDFAPEAVPPSATIVAHRRTTPLFGFGLIEAIPDADLLALAALEAQRDPTTAGRAHIVADFDRGTAVGRFGWKAQVGTLRQFSGDAYLNEMGITNPIFPNENCPQGDCSQLAFNPRPDMNDLGDGVEAFTNFMRLLGAPPRAAVTDDVNAGEVIFEKIGCAACHAETQHTASSDVAALNNVAFHPYSDFLLHDMGSLGDGITQGQAAGHDMRTAPLWGLRMINHYLHDGRATSIHDAILAHDGQGAAARDRFAGLDAKSKSKLLTFLSSL